MKKFLTYWWLVTATMLSFTSAFFAVLLFLTIMIRFFVPDFPWGLHE